MNKIIIKRLIEKLKKLYFYINIKRLFIEYKKSINWTFFIGIIILCNIAIIFDGWTTIKFFLINGTLLLMSFLTYIKWKLKIL